MLRNYFTNTFRVIRRASIYSLLNISGLALGIACAALIFLWVEDELSFDYGYAKHDRLYSLRMDLDYSGKIETFFTVPGPMPDAIRGTVPGIVNNSRTRFDRELFALNDKTTYEWGLYADTSIFSMLQLNFISGNAAGFNNPYSLVLTEKMAQKFFGSANAVGKTLRMNNAQDFVIIGVVRNPGDHVSIRFDWLAPVSNFLDRNIWLKRWGTYGISTLVELSPGTDVSGVNRQLTDILRPNDPLYKQLGFDLLTPTHLVGMLTIGVFCGLVAGSYPAFYLSSFQPVAVLKGVQLAKMEAVIKANNPGYPVEYSFVDEQFNDTFEWQAHMGTLAGVFAVLAILISCMGLFGLAAYTAERRTKEIGIRKVLGASVSGLAALLSGEFLRLVALSCLIAFPVAWWLMHGWLADFPYRTAIHWWVFGLAGIAAIVITLLTVSFQAIRAAFSNPVKTLRAE